MTGLGGQNQENERFFVVAINTQSFWSISKYWIMIGYYLLMLHKFWRKSHNRTKPEMGAHVWTKAWKPNNTMSEWVRDMVVNGRNESAATKPARPQKTSTQSSFKRKKRKKKGKGRKISRELFALLGSDCAKAVSVVPTSKTRPYSSNISYGGQRLKNDKKWFVPASIIMFKISTLLQCHCPGYGNLLAVLLAKMA